MNIKEKILQNRKHIIVITIVLIGIFFLNKEKTYSNDLHKEYTNKTNKEMQELKSELKGIAYSFAQDNDLPNTYRDTMYDCLGYLVYSEKPDSKLSQTMQICKDDYAQKDGKAIYYNEAWLRREFSRWNGAYLPMQKVIQKYTRKPESYEHLETASKMVFNDERPHMFVSMHFKAVNMYGYILDRNMTVKVDAKTKELYDMK